MLRLATLLYSLAGAATAGTAVAAALVMGYDDGQAILTAASLGALLGIPVSLAVAVRLTDG